jgi:predicted nucleic acid-binding Zn ribbon protein
MVIEKKLIKIDKDSEVVEDSQQIKNSLDKAIAEQKRVRRMIDLFVLALFLVFLMFMVS